MMDIKFIFGVAIILLILVIFNECFQSYWRNYQRKTYYRLAQARAAEIGKPLVVVGDAHNGLGSQFHGVAYGSGDYVIDVSGCSKNICENVIEKDIIQGLKTFEDDSCVIFVSCVLEYVEDIDEAIKEINRVAGSSDNIFVVIVGSSCLSAYYYSYDNNGKHVDKPLQVFTSAPPIGEFNYFPASGKVSKSY